ncbi:MAG: ABC transporter ATP-binding protein [Anaerolineae bacterium]|nr:ABC transporter ATP-binding protein [Anaerolineae bacterium]
MTIALRAERLSRCFGEVVAVSNASLEIASGEIGVLVGPSGCGKSTLLRLIAGLEPPDPSPKSRIQIGERVVYDSDKGIDLPPDQRLVGLVFQDYALFPHMTVAENIAFGLHTWSRQAREARVREMLAWVRLEGLAQRYPHELSGGQQQRVALARALAPRPTIVLLDEPFSNLDHALRVELREDVRELLKQSGVAALFVTHDREEALSLADTLLMMDGGRILQTGAPQQLYLEPASIQVGRFLGEANLLAGVAQGSYAVCVLGEVPLQRTAHGMATILIRPEALEFHPDANGDAVVERRLFFGHDQLISVKLDGVSLLVRASSTFSFAPGQRGRLRCIAPAVAL